LGSLFVILRIAEFISCFAGLIYWRKIRTSVFKWFFVYLCFIVVSESIGSITQVHGYEQVNLAYFNYFEIPIEFLFFFWLFYNTGSFDKYKSLPIVCAILYLLSWLTDILYLSKLKFSFYSFSYTIGTLLLLIVVLRYFITLVTSNHIFSFWKDMLFWICTGLLVYYLGTFPYYGLRNTLLDHYRNLYITYSYIIYFLNSLMYILFTFSFIWGKPNTKSL
jgi:hypothetical protein